MVHDADRVKTDVGILVDDPEIIAIAHDEERNKKLNRRLDVRILPLCCWIYLLNFLDRGNIGNAKVLNSETHDDMLSQTHMTSSDYAVVLTIFSLAYFIFEVPSNWIMKHYVRPSLWLGILLGAVSSIIIWEVGRWSPAACHSYRTLPISECEN